MKQLFITLLILGLIYFCYWYITRIPDVVKVTAKVNVFEGKTDEDLFRANIQGTAENTGSFTVKNVWIIYKIEDEEVTAYIGELKESQKVNFRTGTRQIKKKNPGFELISLRFDR